MMYIQHILILWGNIHFDLNIIIKTYELNLKNFKSKFFVINLCLASNYILSLGNFIIKIPLNLCSLIILYSISLNQ